MANTDWQTGLRPVSVGRAGTAPVIHEYIAATAVYEGQLLYLKDTGVLVATDGIAAAEYGAIVGVAAHYAAADANVAVYDDPDQEFEIQDVANVISTTTTLADAKGMFAALVSNASANSTTLQCKGELNTAAMSSVFVGTTHHVQILRESPAIDSSVSAGSWTKMIVKIAQPQHLYGGNPLTGPAAS